MTGRKAPNTADLPLFLILVRKPVLPEEANRNPLPANAAEIVRTARRTMGIATADGTMGMGISMGVSSAAMAAVTETARKTE